MCRCFIVPPDLLHRVARTGTPSDRDAALRTLAIDATIRTQRVHTSLVRPVLPPAVGTPGNPHRTIFDAHHLSDPNARAVVRDEGQPAVPDQSVDEAYDALGDTYSLYWDVFKRNSIDGAGMDMLGEVHYSSGYDNAFWDGERMIFGDGDGRLFTGFTGAIDVVGHELTHGVTQFTANLHYLGQPGALNESISDVFGSLVKQYHLGQSAQQADWLIGAGILGPAMHGVALRSMKAPGTAYEGDAQPGTMAGYVHTMEDNGGVHTNSGIPNHAFYLAATALGGNAWEAPGAIWYGTLTGGQLGASSSFGDFAKATVATATRLFGDGSKEAAAVAGSWAQVGVSLQ